MPITRSLISRLPMWLLTCLIAQVAVAGQNEVEQALSEVRHVRADLHSRTSNVLGTLPGPAETAAHQKRCRPAPQPKVEVPREIDFDDATLERAATLNPAAWRASRSMVPGLSIFGSFDAFFCSATALTLFCS